MLFMYFEHVTHLDCLVTQTSTVIHVSHGVCTHKISMPLDEEEFFPESEREDILN